MSGGSIHRPTVRARVVRRAMIAGVHLMRSVGAGGVPDPDGPESELEEYALRMRTAMERFFARLPATRGVQERPSDGAPTDGTWIVDDRAWRDGGPRDDEVAGTDRVVLHVHGGGYALGSPATHRGLAATLSRTAEAAVHLPAYRLAPEHPFPAAFDDVVATYRWLTDDRRVEPGRIAVTGDSAGGGLGLALIAHLRDLGQPLPACYVGLSPWTDLAGTGASFDELDDVDPWISAAMARRAARAYAGETALDDPRVSPLYADLTGLPPMLVHVGGHEVLLDDAVRVVAAAREAGVEASLGRFEGLWHMFQAFPGLPEARFALREIGAFVQRHTASDTSWSANGAPR